MEEKNAGMRMRPAAELGRRRRRFCPPRCRTCVRCDVLPGVSSQYVRRRGLSAPRPSQKSGPRIDPYLGVFDVEREATI